MNSDRRILLRAVALGGISALILLPVLNLAEAALERFDLDNFITPNQIILSGRGEILQAFEDSNPEIFRIGFASLVTPPFDKDCINLRVYGTKDGPITDDYEARIYEVRQGSVADKLRELAGEQGIVSEANYLSGRNPIPVDADPWGVGADPWGVGADPWGVGADPWGVGADPNNPAPVPVNPDLIQRLADSIEATVEEILNNPDLVTQYQQDQDFENWINLLTDRAGIRDEQGQIVMIADGPAAWLRAYGDWLFEHQWAMTPWWEGKGGINPEENSISEYNPPYVLIGVFDTSPFRSELERGADVSWPSLDREVGIEMYPVFDIRNHGLFAAGLASRISPNSKIELYRVLNDGGQGDLFVLLKALGDFTDRVVEEKKTLYGAVINLSSGVHKEEELFRDPTSSEDASEIHALKVALANAYCHDISIVAASGNDSGSFFRTPKKAQLPAAWNFVIGVGSSNKDSERSCFSNLADVYAPGGDGQWQFLGLKCRPMIRECPADNKYCVVSFVKPEALSEPMTSTEASDETAGFAYWTGTSFSTPLVSGLAARMMEDAPEMRFEPGIVKCQIESLARSGTGSGIRIIQIENTVQANLLNSCEDSADTNP